MPACGLDFGTSNTTLGVVGAQGDRQGARLVPLEGEAVTLPSAIFFPPEGEALIGRAGIAAYVEGQSGRLMRSLKSVLGRPLLDETTQVGRERIAFRAVIARYLAAVKARAEAQAGQPLDSVVHGRPVHFVDGDPEGDRRAEEALAGIAATVGFRHVSFEYEPIAAARAYERRLAREEVALIADIGGGTSDFSVVRLGAGRGTAERARDILANDGVRIGGTDFDRLLSLARVMPLLGYRSPMRRPELDVPSSYFHDLATWSSINGLYAPKVRRELESVARDAGRPELLARLLTVIEAERGHTLAMEVEDAKVGLSDREAAEIDLGWVERGLFAAVDRADLVSATAVQAERLAACARACIGQAGLRAEAIDTLFLTGGSTRLLHARAAIVGTVPGARVIEGDIFGAVGLGLTIEAERRYG